MLADYIGSTTLYAMMSDGTLVFYGLVLVGIVFAVFLSQLLSGTKGK